jgi:hypothetical protein
MTIGLFYWRITMISIEVTGSMKAREFAASMNDAYECAERALYRLKREGYRIFKLSKFVWQCDGRLNDTVQIEISKTY